MPTYAFPSLHCAGKIGRWNENEGYELHVPIITMLTVPDDPYVFE